MDIQKKIKESEIYKKYEILHNARIKILKAFKERINKINLLNLIKVINELAQKQRDFDFKGHLKKFNETKNDFIEQWNKYIQLDNTVEKISAINDQIEVDKVYDYYIAIKVNPENAILYDGEVKYEIEDPSIISVSNDGKINPLKDGTTNVKCYLSDNEDIFTIVKVNVHLDYMLGDLNEDWIINADDAAEAIEIFKTNAQTDYNKARGDMNSDNKVDAEDAALIIEYFKTHK